MTGYKEAYYVGEVNIGKADRLLAAYDIVPGSFQLGTTRITSYPYAPAATYVTIAFRYYVTKTNKSRVIDDELTKALKNPKEADND